MVVCPFVGFSAKEMPLAITNITVGADAVNLSWADYSGRTDFTGLRIDSVESLGILNWAKVTNVAPSVSSVSVSTDTSPSKFFRLIASVISKVLVTFDSNGGAALFSEKELDVGAPYELPTTTRGGGYSFINWFTAQTGGDAVTAGTLVENTAAHTLWAQWSQNPVGWVPNPFSVTVTNTPSAPASFTVPGATGDEVNFTYGVADMLPSADWGFNGGNGQVTVGQNVLPGTYSFKLSAEPSNGLPSTNLTVNVTVKRQVTVTFNGNGGNAPSPSSKTVIVDEPYGALATGTHASSYQFAGWWTGATTGAETFAANIVSTTSDHTLYARWVEWILSPSSVIVTNTATASSPNIVLNAAVIHPSEANGPALTYAASQSGFSFNAGARALSANAGTPIAFYNDIPLVLTVGSYGTVNRAINVELRQFRQYFFDEDNSPDNNDWNDKNKAYTNTAKNDANFAFVRKLSPGPALTYNMYLQRQNVGNEQPANARAIDASVSVRNSRSFVNSSSPGNNAIKVDIQTSPSHMAYGVLMTDNASTQTTANDVFQTITRPVPFTVLRGETAILRFESVHQRFMAYSQSSVAWAELNIVWAP